MRAALQSTAAQRQRVSTVKSLPAPVGGWNARDALAEMPVTDAVALDNFFPKSSYVELRGGYISHTTEADTDLLTESGTDLITETGDILATEDTVSNISGNIKTLAIYNALTGFNKMFAMTNTGIYDVSTSGVPGASLLARTEGKHQYTMFGDGTNNWLIAANGVDKIAYYDGTTWLAVDSGTSPTLSGLATTSIIGVNVYKGRVFFIEKGSLSFWYLPAAAAGGTLTEFDLSSQCKRGGYLMAMASWTRDAGDGQDDVAVFVTSEGEAVVYQGDNPSNANSWSKVGSFYVGKPIGRRCLTQYGGDLLIITENGAFPISQAMQSAVVDYRYALSNKIDKAFTEASRNYGGQFGWEATIYPAQEALIVNVPLAEDGQHVQYVMNTLTKAWCRFLSWNAETFAVFNKELYFASGNNVYKAWTGSMDGVDAIEFYGKQAYSQFGQTGLKMFELFRPIMSVNGSANYLTALDVDFEDTTLIGSPITAGVAQATWDSSQWDNAYWAGGFQTVKQWNSVSTYPGYWGAGKVKGATNSLSIQWTASDVVFQSAGVL